MTWIESSCIYARVRAEGQLKQYHQQHSLVRPKMLSLLNFHCKRRSSLISHLWTCPRFPKMRSISTSTLTARGPDDSSLLQVADIAKKAPDGPELLAQVLTFIHQNQHLFSDDMRLAMNSVRSVCLTKPNGDFRPIGVGKSLFRLYQGIIMARNTAVVDSILHQDNHTIRSNGISNIIAATQRCAEAGFSILLTDRSNAFNRTSVVSACEYFVKKHLTEIAHLGKTIAAHYVVHPSHGSTLTGHLPQGSSFGSIGMAAVMDKHLEPLREPVSNDADVLIVTHTDDVTFIGWDQQKVLEKADLANLTLSEEGIPENLDKRVMRTPQSTNAVKTLGAFVGTDLEIEKPLSQAIDEVLCDIDEFVSKVASYRLEEAPIRHTAFRTLRTSFIPRLIHLMQHHPAHVTQPLLQRVDDKIIESVARILCLTETEAAERRTQLQLPISRGGFGFVSLAATVHLQRFGMLARSISYVTNVLDRLHCEYDSIFPELTELIERFTIQLNEPESDIQMELNALLAVNQKQLKPTAELLKSFRKLQRKLGDKFVQRNHEDWLCSFPKENLDLQERVNSLSARESGKPLNVVTAYRPNHLNDSEFIAYARHRLLIAAIESGVHCVDTHSKIDPYLDHAICCKSRGRGVMHTYVKNAVYDVACDLARYHNQVVTMEPPIAQYLRPEVEDNKNEKTIHGMKQRRGDISLESVTVATHYERTIEIIDVRHCTMTTPKSSLDIGRTVDKGEKEKTDFYKKHFAFPNHVHLIPFVVDTYGRWGDKAKEWLEKACKKAAGTDKELYNKLISRYRETISLAHARGIGRTMERCIRNCIHPNDYVKTCTRDEGRVVSA